MKTDISIKNITIAAINRSGSDLENWQYSKIITDIQSLEFPLANEELPIFQIKTPKAQTLVTTRRIIEKSESDFISLDFDELDGVVFGDFKKQMNKPEISIFRTTDIYGEELNFQMETGKASIGLITTINTVKKLRASG